MVRGPVAVELHFVKPALSVGRLVAPIHDRMPVLVDPANFDAWLTAAEPPMGLLRPYAAAAMKAYPVSRAVNSPAQDEPSLIEPLTGV